MATEADKQDKKRFELVLALFTGFIISLCISLTTLVTVALFRGEFPEFMSTWTTSGISIAIALWVWNFLTEPDQITFIFAEYERDSDLETVPEPSPLSSVVVANQQQQDRIVVSVNELGKRVATHDALLRRMNAEGVQMAATIRDYESRNGREEHPTAASETDPRWR